MEKYKKSYLISSFQVDIKQKLRIRSLFNLFQDLADEHAEKIGVGYTFCRQNGLGWVGGAYHVKINRLPTWGEVVTIETWPSGTTAAAGIRDFRMSDSQGTVLVEATSQWVLIDTARLRPVPVAKHLPHYDIIDEHTLPPVFPKVDKPETSVLSCLFPVHADDIDLNCHVNNALYPTWVLDGFDEAFLSSHQPTDIQIAFKRPAKYGDTIALHTYHGADNTTTSVLTNEAGTVEFSLVKIEWTPLKG